MSFVQIIKLDTDRFEDIEAAHEDWLRATEGTRTVVREELAQNRDEPGEYWMIVEFPSYDEAMRNNDLPAAAEIAQRLSEASDAPPEFVNLDVVRME